MPDEPDSKDYELCPTRPDLDDLIMDFIYHEDLTEDQCLEIAEHLGVCEFCQDYVRFMLALQEVAYKERLREIRERHRRN